MNATLLLTSDYLGCWVNDLKFCFNVETVDVYVIKSAKASLFYSLCSKIDGIVFGKSKSLRKEGIGCNVIFISKERLEESLEDYDTIINTTSLALQKRQGQDIFSLKVSNRTDLKDAILYNTVCAYEKVTLSISDEEIIYETSLRFHPLSFSKNTDLVLHAFLSLLSVCVNKRSHFRANELAAINTKERQISLLDCLRYLNRFAKRTLEHFLYNEQWVIGYNLPDEKTIGIDGTNIREITPPKDRFWADPFVVLENNRYYIFVEELIYKNKIAHLSVFELKLNGSYSAPTKILEKPYHLSYPFIFKLEERYYMIPETANNSDIQLYESVEFPHEWRFKKVLIDNIKASDTTLLAYDNKWWLFTSIKEYDHGVYDNNLVIYYSDDLLNGSWTEHRGNPVKHNILNSRQGGGFFEEGSSIFRVSQNCSKRYGYGFSVNRIKSLTTDYYEEEEVYSFAPMESGKIKGIHTYNQLNNRLKVFDILIRQRKF